MVNRRLLYAGVFLVTAGAAMLLVRGEAVDEEFVIGALRFWPVLVIGLGVGLVLRGTRFRLAGGMLAAAMPGLLLGGLVMAAPDMATDCGASKPATFTTRQGSFDGPATVDLSLACGELTVSTTPGSGWEVRAGETSGPAASVHASGDRLTVESSDRSHRFGTPWGGDALVVTLPTDRTLDLAAEVNAGRGRFDLAGARLGHLSMNVNAATALVRLPATGDFDADFAVNAAELTVCTPADLGLRIHQDAVLGATTWSGLARSGDAWETPGYSMAAHHANVTVSVNVGSVDVSPEGDCK